jgi:hypothetical protein
VVATLANNPVFANVRQPPKKNPHSIVVVSGDVYDSWEDKQLFKEVSVELVTNQACEARFKVFDPKFRFLDRYSDGDGAPPLPMLFFMGFGQDLGPPVFKGMLHRVERGDTDSALLAYDMGWKMRQERKGEYHEGIDDLEIIRRLATRNGLKFEGPDEVDPPLEIHVSMPQDSKNDWEHSWERAREAGFDIYVRQDTLFCKNPAKFTAPILRLRYREDFILLHDFDLTYKLPENDRGRPKLVEYRGRREGGKRLTGVSKTHPRGTVPKQMTEDLAMHTRKWAKRRAHAHKEHQREPSWNCTIQSVPQLPGLRPDVRDTIELENVGELFSGPYLCDKVRHEHTGSAFKTDYTLYRDRG